MKILEEYVDDRSALEAAITLIESDPPRQVVRFEVPIYGPTFIDLFKEALEELDAAEAKADFPLDGDRLYIDVVSLARGVLICAHESQRNGATS